MIVAAAALAASVACAGTVPVSDYAMAYHAGLQRVVVFGGFTADDAPSADVYAWDGKAWSCVSGAGPAGPRARGAAMLAWDAKRGVLVLYGGRVGPASLRDTWELGADGWKQADTSGPTPDPHGAMAYDSASGAVLLFHTLGDDGPSRSTWRWDGVRWTKLADGPSAEFPDAMFDGGGGRPARLITARRVGDDAFAAATYDWSGSGWAEVVVAGQLPQFSPQAPAARTSAGAVLFAGFEPGGVAPKTWVLERSAWRAYEGPAPGRRKGAHMVFDAARSVVVLHAGDDGARNLTDTWEWDGRGWRRLL